MPQKYQNPKDINLLSLITLISILKTFDIKRKNLKSLNIMLLITD